MTVCIFLPHTKYAAYPPTSKIIPLFSPCPLAEQFLIQSLFMLLHFSLCGATLAAEPLAPALLR